MSRVLVTGGAGFIGSNLCNFLSAKGYYVICLDNLSGGYLNNLRFSKNLKFIKGSCNNLKVLKEVFNLKPEVVFHLAARKGFNITSVINPLNDLKTNTVSTINLLNMSNDNNIKKFIYASSSCVYGNILNKVNENSSINLDTPYAISKFTSEEYCKFFQKYHSLNTTIFRIFNTYGPGERVKKVSNVICRFLENSYNDLPLKIKGDESSTRSYLYVDDLIRAFYMTIKTNKFNNEIFNIGSEETTSIAVLAKLIKEISDSKSKITKTPYRDWDVVIHRSTNINKIKKISNWKPRVDLKLGLRKYNNWFKNNCV